MSTVAVGKDLSVRGFSTRGEMGEAAAADIGQALRDRLDAQEQVRMLFASAPSQHEMQQALLIQPGVDWTQVFAFHLDEYIGLPSGAPQRFGKSLSNALFQRLPFAAVHLIEPEGDPARRGALCKAALGSPGRYRLPGRRRQRTSRLQ